MAHRSLAGAVVVLLLGLAGCPGPTVDGSSNEALTASTTKMKESLSDEKRREFEEALQILAFANIQSLGDLMKVGQDPEALKQEVRRRLAGKSVDQIIEEARTVKAEREARAEKERAEAEVKAAEEKAAREARERERKLQQVSELVFQLQAASASREVLKKFEIGASRLTTVDIGFVERRQIHLEVTNRTDKTVSRAFFNAEVLTPGRDLPWVSTDFNYEIPGGLQAGESAVWVLSPNMFGDFARVPTDREDCVLVVACQKLEGANREAFANDDFDQDKAEQLRKLADDVQPPNRAEIDAEMATRVANQRLWRAQEVRRQLQLEIDALQAKKTDAQTASEQLAKLRITASKLYFSRGALGPEPVIEVAAENNTGTTISRVFVAATVRAPDRELPILEADFNFACDGGLAPGRSDEWKLAPNRFSDWGRLPSDRRDLSISLRVKDLQGPDGKSINTSAPFTDADEKRLTSLLALRESTKTQ